MKKIISAICAVLIVVLPCSVLVSAVEIGDADNNGEIKITDVTYIQKVLAQAIVPDQSFYTYADFNGDGKVTITDATKIQLYLANYDVPQTTVAETTAESTTVETQPDTTQFATEITEPTTQVTTEPTDVIEPSTQEITTEPMTEPTTEKIYPSSLELDKTTLALGVGEVYELKATTDIENPVLEYSSNNNTVAEVASNGVITAKTIGTALIECKTENSITQYCIVTVKKMAESVTLNKTELVLGVGETFDLNSSIPSGTSAYHRPYFSGNNAVATVAEGGGLVTAIKEGTTIIRCVLANGKFAECKVTVLPMAEKITLNATDITLYVGNTYDLNSYIPNGTAAYHRAYSSSNTSVAKVASGGGLVTAQKVGTCVVTCTLANGKSVACNVYVMPTSKKISSVPLVNQYKLPTGCETCSAAMLLQFYGYNVSETTLADNYLIKKDLSYSGNYAYGADPNSAFIGNPYSSNGFGVYAPAMAKSMNKYLATKSHSAVAVEGKSLEYLCGKYIAQGKPVMVWATINMVPSYKSMSWTVNYTDENSKYKKGDTYTWIANEHCLVLTGYDSNNYYFNDPWTNAYVSYSKSTVNTRYAELGKQAVVLEK